MATIVEKIDVPKEEAERLHRSGFWKNLSMREIVQFQLFTRQLCVPFAVFHKAVEKCLGRPVYTHEFGLNYNGLVEEFLGNRPAPSLEEIINLIPEDKRMLIQI